MPAPSSDKAGIRQIIRALRGAGWELDTVHDGEEDIRVTNEDEAIDAVTAVDQATLYVKRKSEIGFRVGYVFFVLGNDPEEVAADYTVNLESVLGPLTESWWD